MQHKLERALTHAQEFFNALCPGQQSTQWSNCADAPDIIGAHAYATDLDGLTSKVESFYSTFGRPIIVSEFAMAVSGVGSTHDDDEHGLGV